MPLTEEEQIERRGTDSTGEGIDLRLHPASLVLPLIDRNWRGEKKSNDNVIREKVRHGWNVKAPKVGPEGTRIYTVRFPVNLP